MTAYSYSKCSKCDREFSDGPRENPYCRSGEGCGGLAVPEDKPEPIRTDPADRKPGRGKRKLKQSPKNGLIQQLATAKEDHILDVTARTAVPNLRPDRILPARLAMVSGTAAARDAKRSNSRLFLPARHLKKGENMVLPGFEFPVDGPCLPLALYDLGVGQSQRKQRPAPLALRIFIEACLASPMDKRDKSMRLTVRFRDFLDRLWPKGWPNTKRRFKLLDEAVAALQSTEARIPFERPDGTGGLWQVVSVLAIPRGPEHLEDEIILYVELPPGSGPGPVVSPRLHEYGVESGPAYRALLNLAFRWFVPGRTRRKVNNRHWVQSNIPEKYPAMTDRELLAICYPTASVIGHSRREYVRRAHRVLERLAGDGEVRLVKGHILPPDR